MSRTALITGISGQDGAYLARFLLAKGYRVVGGIRRTTAAHPPRLVELGVADDVEYVTLDLLDTASVLGALEQTRPDEIYNLAAQSVVAQSFDRRIATMETDALGPARLLECVREAVPDTRFYQASSSEMFGKVDDLSTPQREDHAFHPRSPYGVSKLFAHWLTINYRESFGLFAVSGILFNHESPLRGREFVTRKITLELSEIKHGRRDPLLLGNIEARRDWGFAGDYVEGMWLMLQRPVADEYVLATGRTESVQTFVELAGERLGFAIEWEGKGSERRGIDRTSGRTIVRIDRSLYRPADIEYVRGDAGKARETLGWSATTSLDETIAMMVEADERRVRQGTIPF